MAQGQFPAQVIGQEPSGETVVKTALGTVKVTLPSPSGTGATLPVGTQFTLKLETITQPAASTAANIIAAQANSNPAPISELSMQWRGLQEAMEIITQAQPALAAHIIENVMPKPGQKMATEMLFFLTALRGGDMGKWLGDRTMQILEEANRGDLIRKLTSEFGSLRQFFTDSPSPNWQAVFVPVYQEDHWQQARLFLRKEPETSSEEAAGTRFIMEVELTQMGPMQLDGLVRKRTNQTHFDLIIRSRNVLTDADRQNIRDIYENASELTGFNGGISFQTVTPFPILPMKDILYDAPDVMA